LALVAVVLLVEWEKELVEEVLVEFGVQGWVVEEKKVEEFVVERGMMVH
jgi:hypothetical protein